MKHLEYLADTIGSRVAGGPGVGLAAEYLATQFESAGLTVERQTFQFSSFADRGSSLEVLAPAPASLASTTLTHSGAGAVEAELVEVGLARPGDFDPADVRGRVALALRGEIRFSEKAANLAQAGASGLVIANNQPGSYAGSLGGQVSLPVVGVSQADGEQLRRQIANGPTRVRLAVDADSAERTGVNVQGSRPGGSQMVIIGAHYDSVSAGPGANDNASGTATMLELARVVAARQYPFTVRFVGFDAEEIGLIGSARYVSQLDQATREATLAMINLDMVGVGDRLAFGGDGVLIEPALRAAAGLGTNAGRMRGGAGSSSDHASFQAAGIPSLFVYRGEDPNYHSAGDQARQVSPDHLATAGNVVLAVLDDLAAGAR
jgi:aminopeptidase YwaD